MRRFFQKATEVEGEQPRDTAFLWFFLCANLVKKRTDRSRTCNIEKIRSVLFDTAGAKKNIFRFAKSNAKKISPVATGDEGFAPSTRANF